MTVGKVSLHYNNTTEVNGIGI